MCVPSLRTSAAIKNFRATLSRYDDDLVAWRVSKEGRRALKGPEHTSVRDLGFRA